MSALLPRRPLIVRLRNWIGDVVLSLPALNFLEEQGYDLILVGKPWAQSLLSATPWPIHPLGASLMARIQQLRQLATRCRQRDAGFDQRLNTLVFPFSFSSALETRMAGLRALGYRYEARGWLLHRAHDLPHGGHEIERYWQLTCALIGMPPYPPVPTEIHLPITAQAQRQARERLAQAGIRGRYWILCPFAGGNPLNGQARHWPEFPALAEKLRAQGLTLILCPGPQETKIAQRDFPGITMLEHVPLATYAALIANAQGMVANDTGPGHMAAAVGTPLFSLMGPTPPTQWRAWGPSVTVLHRPGAWPSLTEVLQALQTHIALTAGQ